MTTFTADHHGYYQKDKPFVPTSSNVVCVRLPACLNDSLNWSEQREQVQQIIASGKAILWEIDLGLPSFTFTPENSAAFFSFSVALEEFTATLWPEFKAQTFGVALYRGGVPNETNFPIQDWEAAYLEKSSSYDVFCTQMMSEYIHRLVSFLPDSVLAFVIVDVSSISSPGKIAQLFSKARFEHVHVILEGWDERYARAQSRPFRGGLAELSVSSGVEERPSLTVEESPPFQGGVLQYASAKLGLYLPKDELVDASLIQEFDKLMIELKEKGTPYRIIPEEKLTEQWDGIDTLIVPEQAISTQGRRKLLGFAAAGGNILSFAGREIKLA